MHILVASKLSPARQFYIIINDAALQGMKPKFWLAYKSKGPADAVHATRCDWQGVDEGVKEEILIKLLKKRCGNVVDWFGCGSNQNLFGNENG